MKATPDPTPKEIEQRCEEAQQTWNDRERWNRAGRPPRWTAPLARVGEIVAAVSEVRQEETAAFG
jgi:hypothetical protein